MTTMTQNQQKPYFVRIENDMNPCELDRLRLTFKRIWLNEHPTHIILDLSQVKYLDTDALDALVEFAIDCKNHRVGLQTLVPFLTMLEGALNYKYYRLFTLQHTA